MYKCVYYISLYIYVDSVQLPALVLAASVGPEGLLMVRCHLVDWGNTLRNSPELGVYLYPFWCILGYYSKMMGFCLRTIRQNFIHLGLGF